MSKKAKISTILSLGILSILLVVGTYFSASILFIKFDTEQKINKGLLEKEYINLVINLEDVKNPKIFTKINYKEFRYKAILYDVVKSDTSAHSITYICYPDKRETRLVNQIENFKNFLSKTSTENPQNSSYSSVNFKLILIPVPITTFFIVDLKSLNYHSLKSNYQSVYLNLDSLPPEV